MVKKYDKKFADQALVACKLGATDADLAKLFKVSVRTIQRWKKNEDFREKMQEGKDLFDSGVVESKLLQKAKGFEYKETHKTYKGHCEKCSKKKLESLKIITKQALPDVAAIAMWLRNRNPKRWPDTKEHHLSGEVKVSIVDYANVNPGKKV